MKKYNKNHICSLNESSSVDTNKFCKIVMNMPGYGE